MYHSTWGAQGAAARASEYAAARNSYSRSKRIAGPESLVLNTKGRGLQVEPASIQNAGDETG